jgi:hypothetical protein
MMRVVSLESALTGEITDPEIRDFILKDLEVVWFRTDKYIFHYLEEMRPKGNEGKFQYNRERINGKKGQVNIRILENNSRNFRDATMNETSDCVAIINRDWEERKREILNAQNLGFMLIYNVSSDREFRIFVLEKQGIAKTTGEEDRRGNRGRNTRTHDPQQLLEFLWEARITNPDGPEDIPTSEIDIKKDLSNLAGRITKENWSLERMQFYYGWLMTDVHGRKDKMIKALTNYFMTNQLLFVK